MIILLNQDNSIHTISNVRLQQSFALVKSFQISDGSRRHHLRAQLTQSQSERSVSCCSNYQPDGSVQPRSQKHEDRPCFFTTAPPLIRTGPCLWSSLIYSLARNFETMQRSAFQPTLWDGENISRRWLCGFRSRDWRVSEAHDDYIWNWVYLHIRRLCVCVFKKVYEKFKLHQTLRTQEFISFIYLF